MRKIVLASASPRRQKILKLLNIDFIISKSNIDESKFKITHDDPKNYCLNLAYLKSKKVSENFHDSIVIGCDTIVYHKNKILGKPKNQNEAIKYLKLLSNESHIVYSAISILIGTLNIKRNIIDKTIVSFNKLSMDDIQYYVENYNPYDKAGGYGIQDWSNIFIKKIDGCYYNVVGFPLSKFYILLKELKNK